MSNAARARTAEAAAIKAIQVRRRQVEGLAEDEAWRAFLAQHADGQTSTRAMSLPQLGRVLDALHAVGAPKLTPAQRAGRARVPRDDMQARKLQALWITLYQAGVVKDRRDTALLAWCARQLGLPAISSFEFLPTSDKSRLIDDLKAWCRREGVDTDG